MEGLAEGIIIITQLLSRLLFVAGTRIRSSLIGIHPPQALNPCPPASFCETQNHPRELSIDSAQAAKLLGDVSVPSYYPALFASIADLLEAFGVMVFERIRSRAEDSGEEAAPPPAQGEAREAVYYGGGTALDASGEKGKGVGKWTVVQQTSDPRDSQNK